MALPLLFAITLHEAAHGWAAEKFGDKTARRLGRISLNPLRHIDPVGTILVPLLIFFSTSSAIGTGYLFGWAKPVPVDVRNLRNPHRDMAWVAVAGPSANLLMMVLWVVIGQIGVYLHGAGYGWFSGPTTEMAEFGLKINAVLMVLNLLPVPPLDGGRILVSLLPPAVAYRVAAIEPYGLIILILLLVTGVLWKLLAPLIVGSQYLVLKLLGFIF